MLKPGSIKRGEKYAPAIRDGKSVVWQGDRLCRNRDVSTPFNTGATDLARMVLMAILDREKMLELANQEVPSSAVWNGGRSQYSLSDWNRLQKLRNLAIEIADGIPQSQIELIVTANAKG